MLAAIEAEAKERRDKLMAEAQGRVANILEAAQAEAARIKRSYFAKDQPRLSGELSRIAHEAKLTAEIELAREKETVLEEAFRQAGERLKAARESGDWPRLQTRLIEEAVGEAGGGEIEVEVDSRDVALTRQVLTKHALKSTVVTAPHWGGAVVRMGEGKIIIDNTLETRWQRSSQVLHKEVLDYLFEEE